tara:strand:+ start:470 stop:964 length:495 start_codon:yes stop_codon:yes gene_type:complete
MQPKSWKRRIGDEAYNYLTSDLPIHPDASIEDVLASILTRLYEIGWRGQEDIPRIDPNGTKVLWPGPNEEGIPVLTSKGLEKFWTQRGHGWVLLRAPQLVRAMAGPLAPRLQEMLAAYEEQCEADEVDPIPEWADWSVFVGGENPVIDTDKLSAELGGVKIESQ